VQYNGVYYEPSERGAPGEIHPEKSYTFKSVGRPAGAKGGGEGSQRPKAKGKAVHCTAVFESVQSRPGQGRQQLVHLQSQLHCHVSGHTQVPPPSPPSCPAHLRVPRRHELTCEQGGAHRWATGAMGVGMQMQQATRHSLAGFGHQWLRAQGPLHL
jgi:hypothetical protein